MMAGVHLGGKYLRSKAYVDYFLLRGDCFYAYPYTNQYQGKYNLVEGTKENCDTDGMRHAAPVILAFWSDEE